MDYYIRSSHDLSFSHDARELFRRSQGALQQSVTCGPLVGEPDPALCPSTGNDCPAGASTHADSKSVRLLLVARIRLIGAFQGNLLIAPGRGPDGLTSIIASLTSPELSRRTPASHEFPTVEPLPFHRYNRRALVFPLTSLPPRDCGFWLYRPGGDPPLGTFNFSTSVDCPVDKPIDRTPKLPPTQPLRTCANTPQAAPGRRK